MFRYYLVSVEWCVSSFQLTPRGAMHPIATWRVGSAVLMVAMLAFIVSAMFLLRTRGARAHTMRLTTMLAALALSFLIGLAGCSAGVGQQLLVERDAFNGTLLAVHTAHVTGALSAQDESKLLPAIQSVQAALDAADAAFKSGDTKGASVYLQAVSAGLAKLAQLYPATRPSTTQPVH